MIRPHEHNREFPGRPEAVHAARQFTETVLGGCPAVDGAVLAVNELAANAVRWSHSGDPGGTFTVHAVVTPLTSAVVYVRDLGARDGAAHGPEGGRGLRIVAAVAEAWGIARGPRCAAATVAAVTSEADTAAALTAAGGTCVWFRAGWQPAHAPDPAGGVLQHVAWLEVMTRARWRCECAGVCGRPHRCPAGHTAGHPLHLVPLWPVTGTAAARLPAAALLALCPDCHRAAGRRNARGPVPAPGDVLFAEGAR